jgi:hypothetical protein
MPTVAAPFLELPTLGRGQCRCRVTTALIELSRKNRRRNCNLAFEKAI